MRLSQALHFYFGNGDLTKSSKRVEYSHFCPTAEDYALRAKLAKEREKMPKVPPTKVLVDLFED